MGYYRNNLKVERDNVTGGGGLLWQTTSAGETSYPMYDGNGNITVYANSAGEYQAVYLYDGFLNVTQTGSGSYRYQASTKSWNPALGLLEYQFRAYSPELGRWIQEDPIEENGGLNLYGFNLNNPITQYDLLGNGGRKGKKRFPNPHPPAPPVYNPMPSSPSWGGSADLAVDFGSFTISGIDRLQILLASKKCGENTPTGPCDCCCTLTVEYSIVDPGSGPIAIIYNVEPKVCQLPCDHLMPRNESYINNLGGNSFATWPFAVPLKCEYY